MVSTGPPFKLPKLTTTPLKLPKLCQQFKGAKVNQPIAKDFLTEFEDYMEAHDSFQCPEVKFEQQVSQTFDLPKTPAKTSAKACFDLPKTPAKTSAKACFDLPRPPVISQTFDLPKTPAKTPANASAKAPFDLPRPPIIPRTVQYSSRPASGGCTPLRLPVCAMTPCRLAQQENSRTLPPDPWVKIPLFRTDEVKVTGLTPLGNIALVPTAEVSAKLNPPTIKKKPRLNLTNQEDPLLKAAIYLDFSSESVRPRNFVPQKMSSISQIASLQKQYTNTFYQLLPIAGSVSQKVFDQALHIYENNQVYYQDRLEANDLSLEEIKTGLQQLEHWFVSIEEPCPKDRQDQAAWREREAYKREHGRSALGDPLLHKYLV